MDIQQGLFGAIGTLLSCSIAIAGSMGPIITSSELHPVVSLQGGYASMNAGTSTQRFIGTDSNLFTYINSGPDKNAGFIGVFLGAEHIVPWTSLPGFFMQTGVEYNYYGGLVVNGINTVGIEPQTSTTYTYDYHLKTQQVLGSLKLYGTTYERFYPYGEVGLGAAFNHAGQYNATTTESGSLNLTYGFSHQSQTQFSYSVGLGVDTKVNTKLRVGLGYRYSNFGSTSLGHGTVTLNNYQSPTSFTLRQSNTYANQLIARISYVA